MDDYVIEEGQEITNDAGTFRVLVLRDPEGFNPRTAYDCHAGIIVAHHRGYDLPREDGPVPGVDVWDAVFNYRFAVVSRWLRVFHGASVVLPLYDAGGNYGPRLAPGSGAEGEDANPGNYIGVVFDSRERWAELGISYDSPEAQARKLPTVTRDDVVETLRAEILEYNAWAHGEMTAWRVDKTDETGDDESWEVVESVGGYYTVEDARDEGTSSLRNIAAGAQEDHVYALHVEALDENEDRDEIRDLARAEMGV